MNSKASLFSLTLLALIATACAKSTPRTAKSGQAASITQTQVSKTDQPNPPAPPSPPKNDSPEINPICKDLKSLAGTLTSKDVNNSTTLTGNLSESKTRSEKSNTAHELHYTSKEVVTDANNAKLKEFDAEYTYNLAECTFRKIPSRAQEYTQESNRKILSVKVIDQDEVEIKAQVCKDSICTKLKDEIKIYSLCLAPSAPATPSSEEDSETLNPEQNSDLN